MPSSPLSLRRLQDIEELRGMPWDCVVLDERQASKSFAQKMYPVLHELGMPAGPRQRISMRNASGEATPEQLLAWASFLKPHLLKVCRPPRACCVAL